MPIENEQKFILSLDAEEDIKNSCPMFFKIQQGYISNNARIRITTQLNGQTIYEFIFKYKTQDNITFVTSPKITEEDFGILRNEVKSVILKTKYILYTNAGEWEVNFLKNEFDETYFVLAEYEMPAWQSRPDTIPDVIQKHLLKIVDKEDASFTNKRLSNEAYAVKKLKVILDKKDAVVKKTKIRVRKIKDA